ncbi:MAG TPA: glycine betaine ABC transporter substrate-binding protein [Geobacteraceae bacterium]
MRKLVSLAVLVAVLVVAQLSPACVGKTILLGISNTAPEKLLADMAAIMITERTGSSVKVQVFKDSRELYNAVRQGKINLIIEATDRAAEIVGKQKDASPASLYDFVKGEYRKNLNLVWLESFGGARQYAPVLTIETLANYPALPKLLNKLAGALANDTCTKLLKSVDSDDKAKKVARDFLKGKKLI